MKRIQCSGQSSGRAGQSSDVRTRIKQRKRKKDLEQLRRNVKATKKRLRQIRSRRYEKQPKNSLERTLENFAEIRQLNDDQVQGLNENSKAICARSLRDPTVGIFRHGVKSLKIQRSINLRQKNEKSFTDDVIKLLNADKTLASRKTSQRNVITESGSDDEENDDKGNVDSTPRHFQSSTIKSKALSGVKNQKSKLNGEKMEKNVDTTKPIASGSNHRSEMIKQRLFESSHDEDDSEPMNFPKFQPLHFHFPPSQAMNVDRTSPKNTQVPLINHNNVVNSVRRWGQSPAFHYRELCTTIQSENFELNYAKHRFPDYLMKIRMDLGEIYSEMHGHRFKIPSKFSESSYEVQACSDIHSLASRSSVYMNPWQNNSNRCQKPLWDLCKNIPIPHGPMEHGKKPPKMLYVGKLEAETRRNLRPDAFDCKKIPGMVNFEAKPEYFNAQEGTSFDESSPCVGWDAQMEYEQNRRRKNVKHVPAILRRASSRPDANLAQSQMNRHQQQTCKFPDISEKIHENESLENPNYLLTPSFIMGRDNFYSNITISQNKAHFQPHSSACHVNQTAAEHTKRAEETIEVIERRENANKCPVRLSANSQPSSTWIPSHNNRENFADQLKNWKTMYADVPTSHRNQTQCMGPHSNCQECGSLRLAQHYSAYGTSEGANSHRHSEPTCCAVKSACQRMQRCTSVERNPPDTENDVIPNFKVLSFEEESCKPKFHYQSPWARAHDHPSKYLAVPTHVDKHPRRIPVYVDATKIHRDPEKSRKPQFFDVQGFNDASQARNKIEVGKISSDVKKLIEDNTACNMQSFPAQNDFYNAPHTFRDLNIIKLKNSYNPSEIIPNKQAQIFMPNFQYHENQLNNHSSQNLPIFKGHNRQY